MGCLSSSEMEDDPLAIPYEMKYTYLYDSIKFWNECEDLLSNAEDLRSGLEDNKDDMLDIADCDKLVDGTLMDAIQGWLWSLSSFKEGAISDCELRLTDYAPYFHIYNWDYNHDVRKFNRCFEDYAKTCFEGPESIQNMIQNAQDLVGRAEQLKDNIKDEAESANLNPLEIARCVTHTAQNIVTLKDGINRMQRLKGIVEDSLKDLQNIIPQFPQMICEADNIGKKCHKEGLHKPDDCLLKFIDSSRLLSDEKIKQQKEEKKRKKKEKKEKKKLKKDAWRKARQELLK